MSVAQMRLGTISVIALNNINFRANYLIPSISKSLYFLIWCPIFDDISYKYHATFYLMRTCNLKREAYLAPISFLLELGLIMLSQMIIFNHSLSYLPFKLHCMIFFSLEMCQNSFGTLRKNSIQIRMTMTL